MVRPLSLRGPRLDPLRSSGRLPRPRYLTWRGCSGFLRTVGLFSCPSSSRRIFLEFYILSSEVDFVVHSSFDICAVPRWTRPSTNTSKRSRLQRQIEVRYGYSYLDLCLISYPVLLKLDC